MKKTIIFEPPVCFVIILVLFIFWTCHAFAQPTISGSTGCPGSILTVTIGRLPTQIVWQLNGINISTVTATIDTNATTVAGTGIYGSGSNQLYYPYGMYVNDTGDIYVADTYNARVQKWVRGATTGTTVAGMGGFGSDSDQLYDPSGVFVDDTGNVYVADYSNNRIQKWAPGATSGTTVAGGNSNGSSPFQLFGPSGVYVDGSGNVYVSDHLNNRIQKWAPGATIGTTVAGSSSCVYGSGLDQLRFPFGICMDGVGNIYIADENNSRIQKWASGATTGTTVAGMGGYGSDSNQLNQPLSCYIDGSNNIYIADNGNNRIQKWASGASNGITIAGSSVGIPGSGTNRLSGPTGVNADGNGNLYVLDQNNSRVQMYAASITTTFTATVPGHYTALITTIGGSISTNTVTIDPVPNAGVITGLSTVCVSSTLSLNDAITGGVWSSDAPSIAIIGSTGIVNGLSAGTVNISYSVSNSCGSADTFNVITVNPLPFAGSITGLSSFCASSFVTFIDGISDGTWSSSDLTVASVDSIGIVTGIISGTTVISYTITNSCGSAHAIKLVTINPLPFAGDITSLSSICSGSTSIATDVILGGIWLSSNPAIAAIDSSTGSITGIMAGIDTILYVVTNMCGTATATTITTINFSPDNISGGLSICPGSVTTLTDAVTDGWWSSSNSAIATIDIAWGIVTGVSLGTVTITYELPTGCIKDTTVIVGDCSLNVNQLAQSDIDLNIFPNPTTGQFAIETDLSRIGSRIIVYNVLGEKVYGSIINHARTEIDITAQPAGMYMVQISNQSTGARVIKNMIKE